MMIKHITLTCILVLLASLSQADIYVVANRDNPIASMDRQAVRDLYLARSRAFDDGAAVTVYDRNDTPLRARFLRSLLGMNERQFDAYWARLVFAGRVLPLAQAEQVDELRKRIAEDVNAIGYMDEMPPSPDLKALLVVAD